MAGIEALLQPLLETVIRVAVPIVMGFVVLGIQALIKQVQARMTKDQLATLRGLATTFVFAAEQTGLSSAVLTAGAEKKAWALNALQAEADRRGIKVDVSTLDALIEAEVGQGLNYEKLFPVLASQGRAVETKAAGA